MRRGSERFGIRKQVLDDGDDQATGEHPRALDASTGTEATPQISEFLTYAQAATFLNVKRGTLYSWVHHKKLRHVRHSSRMVVFRLEDLRKFAEDHIVEPASKEVDP